MKAGSDNFFLEHSYRSDLENDGIFWAAPKIVLTLMWGSARVGEISPETFSSRGNSPLVATGPSITPASEPSFFPKKSMLRFGPSQLR